MCSFVSKHSEPTKQAHAIGNNCPLGNKLPDWPTRIDSSVLVEKQVNLKQSAGDGGGVKLITSWMHFAYAR